MQSNGKRPKECLIISKPSSKFTPEVIKEIRRCNNPQVKWSAEQNKFLAVRFLRDIPLEELQEMAEGAPPDEVIMAVKEIAVMRNAIRNIAGVFKRRFKNGRLNPTREFQLGKVTKKKSDIPQPQTTADIYERHLATREEIKKVIADLSAGESVLHGYLPDRVKREKQNCFEVDREKDGVDWWKLKKAFCLEVNEDGTRAIIMPNKNLSLKNLKEMFKEEVVA